MRSKFLSLALMPILSLSLIMLNSQKARAEEEQGHFRVILTGFRVNHETVESVLSIDGAGDEVFALVNFAEIWSTNNIFGALQRRQSLLYGDTLGRSEPFDLRRIFDIPQQQGEFGTVRAGSMSPTGGLRSRDRFPPDNFPERRRHEAARARMIPMTLWEGVLRKGGAHPNAVVLIPTIWESDNVQDVLLVWHRQADAFIRQFAADSSRYFTGRTERALVEQFEVVLRNPTPQRGDFDRPIGMDRDSSILPAADSTPMTFTPAVMFLTFDSAQAAANSTANGQGVVEIHYHDGEGFGDGDYTLFLLVQQVL
jgi:hypothetical protein